MIKYDPSAIEAVVKEMQDLTTESSNPNTEGLSGLGTSAILELINAEDRTVPGIVAQQIPVITKIVDAAVQAIESGGRLVYVGAGTSGRLGVLDAAECPPTYGVPPTMVIGVIAGGDSALKVAAEVAEDDEAQAVRDLEANGIGERDAILGITARGRTPYVRVFLREAKARGAWTGLLTCNPVEHDSELEELLVLDVGPEVVTGSTRMKAGLATKLALTMISTAAMVRLGRVEGNRMVRLMPNSTKLKARQVKLLMDRLGISLEDAAARLEASGGDLDAALKL